MRNINNNIVLIIISFVIYHANCKKFGYFRYILLHLLQQIFRCIDTILYEISWKYRIPNRYLKSIEIDFWESCCWLKSKISELTREEAIRFINADR